MLPQKQWAIGVDLGGTNIDVAKVDSSGKVHQRLRIATDIKNGPSAVESQIIGAANDLRKKNITSAPVGLGIGIAGQVELHTGIVRFAPNLYWHEVPLLSNIQESLKIKSIATNDVSAATWGEWLYGAGKNCNDLVCLFIGTGIGGGVVSGGNMLFGYSNTAGELGHMPIDYTGPVCHCGNRGCLEALASGWAIARNAKEAISADPKAGGMLLKLAGGKIEQVNAKIVAEAANNGDELANQLLEEVVEALIAGCVAIINAFNPKRLILGGGIIEGRPDMVKKIEKGIVKNALAAAVSSLQVLPAFLKNDSGVIGAAAIAIDSFGKKE